MTRRQRLAEATRRHDRLTAEGYKRVLLRWRDEEGVVRTAWQWRDGTGKGNAGRKEAA